MVVRIVQEICRLQERMIWQPFILSCWTNRTTNGTRIKNRKIILAAATKRCLGNINTATAGFLLFVLARQVQNARVAVGKLKCEHD
jgi:hypothetical protein